MNILITGGLGFIGINTALRFSKNPENKIFIIDNLDKILSIENIPLIEDKTNITFIKSDLRNLSDLTHIFETTSFDVIFHLAAQTAVTLSVDNPLKDFESNVIATFNLLECTRKYSKDAKFIFSSTNKVYGDLENFNLVEELTTYRFEDDTFGIDEDYPLDFYSPYGCSKGSADQYVRDYARIYDLNTTVVRQSCIYGLYQKGTEDQGWVAWFIKQFLKNNKVTIYGNGKQVRDILYIDDLVDFYELLVSSDTKGEIFNMGGGHNNKVSLIEFINILKSEMKGNTISYDFDLQRPGDQKIFVSDNSKAESLGWSPKTNKYDGIKKLIEYYKS